MRVPPILNNWPVGNPVIGPKAYGYSHIETKALKSPAAKLKSRKKQSTKSLIGIGFKRILDYMQKSEV